MYMSSDGGMLLLFVPLTSPGNTAEIAWRHQSKRAAGSFRGLHTGFSKDPGKPLPTAGRPLGHRAKTHIFPPLKKPLDKIIAHISPPPH